MIHRTFNNRMKGLEMNNRYKCKRTYCLGIGIIGIGIISIDILRL